MPSSSLTSSTSSSSTSMKRKSGAHTDISVTKYNPKSMDYILKRSGAIGKNSKKKLKGNCHARKEQVIEEQIYKPNFKVDIPAIIFPTLMNLSTDVCQKTIDFQSCLCHILSLNGKEYKSCITYKQESVKEDSCHGQVFWTAMFYHQAMNISINSYDDVDFYFNMNNATTKDGVDNKFVYTSKQHALLHMELRMILKYKPQTIRQWIKYKNSTIPRIINPKSCKKNFYKSTIQNPNPEFEALDCVSGWICLFESYHNMYAVAVNALRFNDCGKVICDDKMASKVYLLG